MKFRTIYFVECEEPFLTMTDADAWASIFWEEALAEFKTWWESQEGVEYLARQKPFWVAMPEACSEVCRGGGRGGGVDDSEGGGG
uniref:Uncharacterized protein n=1 Tax=Romanomermis culicivorax TaxID=13658 RepID=A0A915I2X2_ROMCU